MFRVFLAVVDVIPAAVVLVPLFGIMYVTVYSRNLRNSVICCLFCLYLTAVFSLVGIPNVAYLQPGINLNLIPFVGMIEDFKNCILNVVLFVPLGVFLPVLGQRFRRAGSCAVFGFGLSLMIELLQMLTFRATDVNDLITNVFGTLLGFVLASPLVKKVPAAGKGAYEPYFLCALSFGVMYFIHPFLSPLMWDSLL
ncbi:MAG: VanZ family protein [Oscillospiraceae bacterium]|nr:VanZ family protein [Oscillospiraceae bacterium]